MQGCVRKTFLKYIIELFTVTAQLTSIFYLDVNILDLKGIKEHGVSAGK